MKTRRVSVCSLQIDFGCKEQQNRGEIINWKQIACQGTVADVDDEEMIKSVRQKETEDSNYLQIIFP